MIFHFDRKYFALALLLFAVEICIALYFTDRVIRPFVGDALVVILLYCFVRSFVKINDVRTAVGVLSFACFIEICQYFDYVKLLNLEDNRLLSVLMGRTFEYTDFAAYAAGFLIVLLCEKIYRSEKL